MTDARFPMTEKPQLALINETTGITLAGNLSIATTLTSRFLGLMGKTDLPVDTALALSQCDWVHTFLVKFPLDLVYCDRQGCVLSVTSNLRPNQFAARVLGAFWAYEMRSGCLVPYVTVGDCLRASSVAASTPGKA